MIHSPWTLLWVILLVAHSGAVLGRLESATLPRRYLNATSTTSSTPLPATPPSLFPSTSKSVLETIPILASPAATNGDRKGEPPSVPAVPEDEGRESSSKPEKSGGGFGPPNRPEGGFDLPGEPGGDIDTPKNSDEGVITPAKTPPSIPSRPTIPIYTYANTTLSLGQGSTASLTRPSCTTLSQNETSTKFIILPNPTTITLAAGGNYSTGSYSSIPEFTPPVYCPVTGVPFFTIRPGLPPITRSSRLGIGVPSSTAAVETGVILTGAPTTTFITTSKNPVTIYTSASLPQFPGPGGGKTDKQTVDPSNGLQSHSLIPPPQFPPAPSITADPIQSGGSGSSGPNQDQRPQDQNLGSPDDDAGANGVYTTVQGVPVEIAPTFAVIGGATYPFQNPPQTITVGEVPISVGPGGLGFPDITIALSPEATNVVILDGNMFSAVGRSLAVFDGRTLTYNTGASSTITTVFNGETITLGTVISFDGTTIGGTSNLATQLGIAGGILVSQVGQSVAIVSSTSLIVGPQAVPTTIIIDTYSITANSYGLGVAGTTLAYPFNPTTQTITSGSFTFAYVGASLVIVGTSTYTIGAGSTPTGTVFNGQTISLGPGGIGLASTTLAATASSSISSQEPTSTVPDVAETSKTSGFEAVIPMFGLLGTCFIICIGYVM